MASRPGAFLSRPQVGVRLSTPYATLYLARHLRCVEKVTSKREEDSCSAACLISSGVSLSCKRDLSISRGLHISRSQQPLQSEEAEDRIYSELENGRINDYYKNNTGVGAQISKKKKNYKGKIFGVELSPDVVAIAMVYFVQGVLGLSRLAVSFFLKDDLQLDPAESSVISGIAAVPWLIKPIYGLISDGIPLFGYRRRSYLVLCGILGSVAWAMMATVVNNKYGAMSAVFMSSLSVAFSDVVVDSMAVERARGESQSTSGSIQSLCWGSSAAGGIVSAYFSGSLVEIYGVRFVFGVTALLPLMTSAVAGLVGEESVTFHSIICQNDDKEVKDLSMAKSSFLDSGKLQLFYLWQTVKEPAILFPTMFIFLWQATPTSDSAMFFFMTNKLGFGPEFLGRVRLITSVASLAGVGIYNGFLKGVPLRRMFYWTTMLGACLGLTQLLLVSGLNQQLGISNEWFSMGDTLVLAVLGQVSFMPVLVLAAKLCPPGVEATLFATLMSICNGASVCGGLLGAGLTQIFGVTSQDFTNLAILLVICNASSLLPLPFLQFLPSELEIESAVEKEDKASGSIEDLKKN
eukprot:c27576_g3_i2 orf=322-2052(+)